MDWFDTSMETAAIIILATIGIYAAVIFFTRLNGLRTLSKMSSFDFAITIAVGSVIATTALSRDTSLLEGIIALAALFGCQRAVSWARYNRGASGTVDNQPVLLMVGKTFFHDALESTRVTQEDIYAKLREANVLDFDEVKAVVFETTGDISVLHGEPGGRRLDPKILQGVSGTERVKGEPDSDASGIG